MPVKCIHSFLLCMTSSCISFSCVVFRVQWGTCFPEGTPSKPNNAVPDGSTQRYVEILYYLPRKEVIQPHLPIRLPCYDFTPVTAPAFDRFDPGFGRERLPWCDGRCVQGPGTYSPQYADLRLLAIPTSCRRVAACNPNWGMLSGVRSGSLLRFPLSIPL